MELPEAPVFRPTQEEWQDPLAYINTVVRPSCEAIYGICKILPPEGWAPPFAIDKRRLKFPTRLQAVHQLQSRDTSAAVKLFWRGYKESLRASGAKHKKSPTFAGQEIDLYRLHRLVNKRGGYQVVTEEKGWRDVATALQVRGPGGAPLTWPRPRPRSPSAAAPVPNPARPPPRAAQ
jgi:histone demethylase JARID1